MGLNDPLPVEHYAEHWGRMPAPKFATPRDLEAPTLGGRQGKFARIWLGKPFMPFQQYIADVGGELEFDHETGLWLPRRKLNVVTLQRQGGKSHMSMSRNGERAISRRHWRAWYTAQTGQDARDQFLKFHEEIIEGSPLENLVNLKRGRGEEILRFANGSTIRPVPPTEEKLHGKQSDGVDIDEAWAFTKEIGQALVQAGSPTKLTRPWAQTWIWSAGGTAESTWLAELVARGRDGDPAIGYFEFGIPDDADAEDLDVITEYHPAYGHTITRRALADMRTDFGDDAPGWARAAGNRWTEIIGGAISFELWRGARYESFIPDDAPAALGVARAADGSQVAIASAARLPDGTIVAEISHVLPTPYGAAEQIRAIARHNRAPVAVPTSGPSKALFDDLEKLGGVRLVPLVDGGDYSAACANLMDGLEAGVYKFREHPDLDAAVMVAGKRNIGDGAYVWARREAAVPVATLDAVTAATHAVRRLRARRSPKLATGTAA